MNLRFALLLCVATPALAQTTAPAMPTQVIDPADAVLPPLAAVSDALDNSPSVREAAARVDAARGHAGVLSAGPHEFTATGSYVRRRVTGETTYNEFDVTVLKPFRLPGKASLDRAAGGYEIKAARNMFADARHQAALTLSGQWFDWVAAHERVTIAQRSILVQQRISAGIALQVRYKDASRLDADRATLELETARSELADATGAEAAAAAMLRATYPTLELPDEIPLPQPIRASATDLAGWRDDILGDSHEIRAAEATAQQYHALAERARLERHADPSVGGRAFSERGGLEVGVGVVGVVPFGGRFRKPALDQAIGEAGAADQSLARVRREILATADTDLVQARTGYALLESAQRAVTAARAAMAKLEDGRKLGGVDLSELLYAQRQLRDAEKIEAEARARAARAVAKLRIDAHRLWAPAEADE